MNKMFSQGNRTLHSIQQLTHSECLCCGEKKILIFLHGYYQVQLHAFEMPSRAMGGLNRRTIALFISWGRYV